MLRIIMFVCNGYICTPETPEISSASWKLNPRSVLIFKSLQLRRGVPVKPTLLVLQNNRYIFLYIIRCYFNALIPVFHTSMDTIMVESFSFIPRIPFVLVCLEPLQWTLNHLDRNSLKHLHHSMAKSLITALYLS